MNESNRLRLLFLSHRLPYAPNRGDRVRAYYLLQTLKVIADVHLLSLVHDAEEESHVAEMRALASSTTVVRVPRLRSLVRAAAALPTELPLTHAMLNAPTLTPAVIAAVQQHQPDAVLAYCSGMARLALLPPLKGIPFVLDMVDVDSEKWNALALVAGAPMRWVFRREGRTLRHFEARAARAAFASSVVTEREAIALRSIASEARVEVIPNGVDVASLAPNGPPSGMRSVVFCGVMNYAPNIEAARFLARDVWPLIRKRYPDATLSIVGSRPVRAVSGLADAAAGIMVTGTVPDVRPYLWSAAVAAAPLVTARGIQNKVLEAVAAGLPTVVTPNIMASLPESIARACVQASGIDGIANAIAALLEKSPAQRRAIADQADVRSLLWERQLRPMQSLVAQAADNRTPGPIR